MAYIISSGITSTGTFLEYDSMTAMDGGVQFVPEWKPQIIYLDFDGELTKYRNADLNMEIDGIQVEDSMLTPERIAGIVAKLNTDFSSYNVLFTSERPKDIAYSTIFIGKTSAFDQYGKFAGLAETVDSGNRIKNDNAFVLLDAANSDSNIVSTIAHEAGHLLGTLDHGGDGPDRYADDDDKEHEKNPGYIYYYYENNHTITGNLNSSVSLAHYESDKTFVASTYREDGGNAYVCIGIRLTNANEVTITNGMMGVYSGGFVNIATVNSGGAIHVSFGGVANNITVNHGVLIISSGGTANCTTINYSNDYTNGLKVRFGGVANSTTVNYHGEMYVSAGGTALEVIENGGYVGVGDGANVTFKKNTFTGLVLSDCATTVHSGTTANRITANSNSCLYVYSGGIANGTMVNYGGDMYVSPNGVANSTTVNSDGYMCVSFGGIANSTTVNYGGDMRVSSGGTATNTTVSSGGYMCVSFGGIANSTTVSSGGYMRVSSGGTANNTTVSSGGYCSVTNGGSLSGCTVYTGGSMCLAEGARLEGVTTIGAGGYVDFGTSGSSLVDGTVNILLDIPASESTTSYPFIFNFDAGFGSGSDTTKKLSVTATDDTSAGTYLLARGVASDFTSSVSLLVKSGETETENEFVWDYDSQIYTPVTIGDKTYTLTRETMRSQADSTLSVTVTVDPISDAAYEYIARRLAYSDRPASEDGYYTFEVNEQGKKQKYYFRVVNIWKSPGQFGGAEQHTGFDAILLERVDKNRNSLKQAVLACGGTETKDFYDDFFADIEDFGVGYSQFRLEYERVYKTCRTLIEQDQDYSLSITGHSLGGALAQYFAAFSKSYGNITQIEDLVTFNSPGLPAVVDHNAIISFEKDSSIKSIRHYLSDGDIVSMAGEYYLSKAESKENVTCTVFINTTEGNLKDYALSQHCDLFFLDILGNKSKGPNLTVAATGNNPNFISRGDFSYLTLYSDVNITVSNPSLRNVLEAVPIPVNDGGGYWLFNKQYAKLINLLTGNDFAFANSVVNRSGTEKNRKNVLSTLKALIKRARAEEDLKDVSEFFLEKLEVGEVNIIANTMISPGAEIRSLKYSTHSTPYAFFDFTHQQFIWNPSISTEIVQRRSASDLIVKAVLPDTVLSSDGDFRVSINVPTYYGSERYTLESIVSDSGKMIYTDSFYLANDSVWLFVDDPESEYYFSFSVNQSITAEKALLDTNRQIVNKDSDEIEIRISDIDAAGNNGMISVLVKSESTPDGITVQLQQSGITGMYTGTFSLSSLASRNTDDHLTIVYEDADNGTGVAETIEKIIDIDNIEWPDFSDLVILDVQAFFTGDFNGGGCDMIAAQSDSTVSVYMNGDVWGLSVTLDPGWKAVGVGDFNGDLLDDFLRVNTEGYVVGEMSNGNGTFSPQVLNFLNEGWSILGTGDFNGNGTDDVLIANPTAASDTVGLLGYWESGVTWTLINGYSAEWEMVATGDFNADGKCDMLWRNSFEGEGGLTYNAYCTWIVENPVDWRMVSVANPDEWNFLCSGDFDGNGSHDIAMINDVGVVGIWGVNDGYLNSWSILSAVTPEWQLAGVGDFNGDGTDDIAWSNTDTGLTGYWQINDKELTTWANIATLG